MLIQPAWEASVRHQSHERAESSRSLCRQQHDQTRVLFQSTSAFTSSVRMHVALPGGPCNRMPRGGAKPMWLNSSIWVKVSSTSSRMSENSHSREWTANADNYTCRCTLHALLHPTQGRVSLRWKGDVIDATCTTPLSRTPLTRQLKDTTYDPRQRQSVVAARQLLNHQHLRCHWQHGVDGHSSCCV